MMNTQEIQQIVEQDLGWTLHDHQSKRRGIPIYTKGQNTLLIWKDAVYVGAELADCDIPYEAEIVIYTWHTDRATLIQEINLSVEAVLNKGEGIWPDGTPLPRGEYYRAKQMAEKDAQRRLQKPKHHSRNVYIK